jgi:hypothetical protein
VPGYKSPAGTNYGTYAGLPLTTTITAAQSGIGTLLGVSGAAWSGYAIAALTNGLGALGSISGTTNIEGNNIAAIVLEDNASPGYFYVAVHGTVAQTLFTEVQFTDYVSGTPHAETYVTASALSFSTSLVAGYSIWQWDSAQGSDAEVFTTSHNPFSINFS